MKDLSWLESMRRERLTHAARNPGFAALMSFFVMGLGQIYAGHVDRGVVFLVIQLTALGCGYSLYFKGFIFDTLTGYLSAGMLVTLAYFCCVVLILLWIYNIKDAYYLSLFAGFRDWFEIEKTVVPFLTNYKMQLLTHQGQENPAPEPFSSSPSSAPPPIDEPDLDEGEVISAVHVKREKPVPPPLPKSASRKASSRIPRVKPERTSDARFYVAIASILIIIGFLNFRPLEPARTEKTEPPDFLAVSKDLSLATGSMTLAAKPAVPAPTPVPTTEPAPAVPAPTPAPTVVSSPQPPTPTPVSSIASTPEVAESLSPPPAATAPVTPEPATVVNASDSVAPLPVVTPVTQPAVQTAVQTPTPIPPAVPVTPEESFMLGMGCLKRGEYASATELFEDGLQKKEARPEVWKALIASYRELNRPDLQEDALKRYMNSYPNDIEERISLGKVQFDRHDFLEASRAFSRALELVPNHPRANFFMGAIYRELGMGEDAIPCLLKALSNDPLNPEYHRELGASYLDIKDFRQARRHLEKVLSVNPQDDAARGLITQLESLAPNAYTMVETVKPPSPTVYEPVPTVNPQVVVPSRPAPTTVPEISISAEKPKGKSGRSAVLYVAPNLSEETLRNDPPKSGKALYPFNKPAETKPAQAVNLIPNEFPAIAKGLINEISSATSALKTEFEAAQSTVASLPETTEALPPENPAPENKHVQKPTPTPTPKKPKTATQTASLEHAVAIEDIEASPDFKKVAGAIIYPKKSKEPEPQPAKSETGSGTGPQSISATAIDNPEQLLNIGRDHYLSGRWDQALPYFLKYLKKRENVTVYDFAGHTLEKVGLIDDAYEATVRAYHLGKTDPTMLIRLGQLAEKTHKYQKGVEFLNKALTKLPHRVDLRFKLAKCLKETGKTDSAMKELEKILAVSSGTYAIQRRVEREMKDLRGDAALNRAPPGIQGNPPTRQ